MDVRIAVISLWAEDVPAAAHFYRDVLGYPLQAHTGSNRPHFNLSGTYLIILKGRPVPPQGAESPFPQVAFAIQDFDSAVERLRSQRMELPWGVETDGGQRWVKFYDPAGNLIELVESKPAKDLGL